MVLTDKIKLGFESVGADVKSLSGKIGDLSGLTTTVKTNLVAAVNELKFAAPNNFQSAGDYLILPDVFGSETAEYVVAVPNEVRVHRVFINRALQISRLSFKGISNGAGFASIGIYAKTGEKIFGTGAINTSNWNSAEYNIVIPNYNFLPDFYFLAWTADNITCRFRATVFAANLRPIANQGVPIYATAQNQSAGGVLPATLGNLTPDTSFNPPFVKLWKS